MTLLRNAPLKLPAVARVDGAPAANIYELHVRVVSLRKSPYDVTRMPIEFDKSAWLLRPQTPRTLRRLLSKSVASFPLVRHGREFRWNPILYWQPNGLCGLGGVLPDAPHLEAPASMRSQ
ncbi:hypothetical protein CONPUDRAFT_85484, partial [Coniophora puteana RWD-64-598 SS2]